MRGPRGAGCERVKGDREKEVGGMVLKEWPKSWRPREAGVWGAGLFGGRSVPCICGSGTVGGPGLQGPVIPP